MITRTDGSRGTDVLRMTGHRDDLRRTLLRCTFLVCAVFPATGCRTLFADGEPTEAAVAAVPVEPLTVALRVVPDVLACLPQRELSFLREFAQAVEEGDWQWALDRAEPRHAEERMGRLGMDKESYLTFLLRMGESFQTRVRRDDAEPGYFPPYDTVRVPFVSHTRSQVEHCG